MVTRVFTWGQLRDQTRDHPDVIGPVTTSCRVRVRVRVRVQSSARVTRPSTHYIARVTRLVTASHSVA